jgi:hypothetical protein
MRIDVSINSPAMLEAGYAGNIFVINKPVGAIINRGNRRAEVFRKSEHYVFDTKVRAFWRGVTRKQGGSAWLSPLSVCDGSAMNQFKLIAICLGLASSALGTCTSSTPSL